MTIQAREVQLRGVEPATLAFSDIDRRLAKGLADLFQTHDVVVVGMSQEDGRDGLVDSLDGGLDFFPVTAWVYEDEVAIVFQIVGVFLGDWVYRFVEAHRIPFLFS